MSEPTLPVELENKILGLQEAVQKRLPGMSNMLQEIWTALKKQPENVTLLSDEQVNEIVSGLEVLTGNKLAEIAVKSTKSKKVKVNLDEL